jgi:cyclopropane fatty-acyl-phospholipid synthase-like methyltransferase|tara:strand:+ start:252 stop:1235 length:984 start_codon:yes stop_codon:yes gene_type:complete
MNNKILEQSGLSHYNADDFFAKRVRLRKGVETVIWVHRQSGHGLLDPVEWPDESYYKEQYREEFSANSDGKKVQTDKHFQIFKKINKKQFNLFSADLSPNTNFLEVGPSHGGIIDHVSRAGVKCYHVVEPNTEDAAYIREKYPKSRVYNSLLEKTDLEKDCYDMVVSFEVLEHTLSPKTFLKNLNTCMKKGAALVLEVPNHDDVLLSCYNKDITYRDFYYHKAHIHYFTAKSLQDMCRECGFDGEVSSFLMYPFFNHVYWAQNHGPQPTANAALSLPIPTSGETDTQKEINSFYDNVEREYEKLINSKMVGDCLVFKGRKEWTDIQN